MDYSLVGEIISLNKYSKKVFDNEINKISKKYNMDISEVLVLLFISKNSNINCACDIVKKHGMSKSYVSKAINSLIEKKYIYLKNNVGDKRIQNIKLLDNSLEIINDIENARIKSEEVLLKNISINNLNKFKEVIDKIVLNAKNYMEVKDDKNI